MGMIINILFIKKVKSLRLLNGELGKSHVPPSSFPLCYSSTTQYR